jgi:hypothetical protein
MWQMIADRWLVPINRDLATAIDGPLVSARGAYRYL